jgi:hypothetical protein
MIQRINENVIAIQHATHSLISHFLHRVGEFMSQIHDIVRRLLLNLWPTLTRREARTEIISFPPLTQIVRTKAALLLYAMKSLKKIVTNEVEKMIFCTSGS